MGESLPAVNKRAFWDAFRQSGRAAVEAEEARKTSKIPESQSSTSIFSSVFNGVVEGTYPEGSVTDYLTEPLGDDLEFDFLPPQSPGPQPPGPQSPGPQSPGPQSPGPQSPGPQSPGSQSPDLAASDFVDPTPASTGPAVM